MKTFAVSRPGFPASPVRQHRHCRTNICAAAPSENSAVTASTPQQNTIFYAGKTFTESEWQKAVESGTTNAQPVAQPAVAATAAAEGTPSFTQIMAFNGLAPEITNGRLAMLAFVSAVAAELASGRSVLKQWSIEPTLISLTFVIFIAASLIPLLNNQRPEQAEKLAIGPFTAKAERWNGRAAMIGFAALLVTEAIQKHALF
jgi:hypothetical protein